jgi:hypothetical protein
MAEAHQITFVVEALSPLVLLMSTKMVVILQLLIMMWDINLSRSPERRRQSASSEVHTPSTSIHQANLYSIMSSATQLLRQEISGRYITHSVLREYLASKYSNRYTIEVS